MNKWKCMKEIRTQTFHGRVRVQGVPSPPSFLGKGGGKHLPELMGPWKFPETEVLQREGPCTRIHCLSPSAWLSRLVPGPRALGQADTQRRHTVPFSLQWVGRCIHGSSWQAPPMVGTFHHLESLTEFLSLFLKPREWFTLYTPSHLVPIPNFMQVPRTFQPQLAARAGLPGCSSPAKAAFELTLGWGSWCRLLWRTPAQFFLLTSKGNSGDGHKNCYSSVESLC